MSSGGSISAALRLSAEVEGATIVAIVCDRGDRCAAPYPLPTPDTPTPTPTPHIRIHPAALSVARGYQWLVACSRSSQEAELLCNASEQAAVTALHHIEESLQPPSCPGKQAAPAA